MENHVRDRRRQRHRHRLRSRGLGIARGGQMRFSIVWQRDAVRLHQGSPGQDRRLRGRVRPGDRRRRQRRHQERHATSSADRLFAYATAAAAWRATGSSCRRPNGSVNTLSTSRPATCGVEGGGRVIRTALFFFGAIDPSWRRRDVHRAAGLPARAASAGVDRDRRTISYAAKATVQLNSSHRVDASFFGDPSTRPTPVRSGPQRCSARSPSWLQHARLRRPPADRPLRRRRQPAASSSRRRSRAR